MGRPQLPLDQKILNRKETLGVNVRLPKNTNSNLDDFVKFLNKKSDKKITKTEVLLKMVNCFPDFKSFKESKNI